MSGMEDGGVVREKGKFAVLGFALSCRLQKIGTEDATRFLDALEAQLESHGLVMGGGIDADRLDIFVLPCKDADATDDDRLALAEWFDRQPLCTEVAVGDWVDAYGVA
ncbi:50S ribosome-binding protein YggL [Chromohalobacter nigrandesensis]|uniref:50S ribosome-binding protein YggL n=1 Tax=Chromohalobacter nigrandesensis TaxID=119863 RepID=UPI001FF6B3F4|nr:50S ribosome-binding protein YggL [Chromohalobacter nigrandesensis]MCK0744703.1 50S ribosome-binding protein YggL [Chromohalobacter nigrandesensis]